MVVDEPNDFVIANRLPIELNKKDGKIAINNVRVTITSLFLTFICYYNREGSRRNWSEYSVTYRCVGGNEKQ